MGNVGEGQGESGSVLMKERSGYLLTTMSSTLSGDDDGTKPSRLSWSEEFCALRNQQRSQVCSATQTATGCVGRPYLSSS